MNTNTIVKNIISTHFSVHADVLNNETDLTVDLDGDSLDILEITTQLETVFGIEIYDDDLSKFHRIGNIISYIENKKER